MTWVLLHLPHLLPPLFGFVLLIKLGIWAADQPPQQYSDEEIEIWRRERAARRAEQLRPVRRGVARAGLLVLVASLATALTGLAIYTFNLRSDRPSALVIWTHSLVAVAAIAIASAKVVALGRRAILARTTFQRPHEALASVALLLLGIPLVASGGWLLIAPSGSSFVDYLHLVVSVWWTLLLQWHLWRYLGRALSASLRTPAPDRVASERLADPHDLL